MEMNDELVSALYWPHVFWISINVVGDQVTIIVTTVRHSSLASKFFPNRALPIYYDAYFERQFPLLCSHNNCNHSIYYGAYFCISF